MKEFMLYFNYCIYKEFYLVFQVPYANYSLDKVFTNLLTSHIQSVIFVIDKVIKTVSDPLNMSSFNGYLGQRHKYHDLVFLVFV